MKSKIRSLAKNKSTDCQLRLYSHASEDGWKPPPGSKMTVLSLVLKKDIPSHKLLLPTCCYVFPQTKWLGLWDHKRTKRYWARVKISERPQHSETHECLIVLCTKIEQLERVGWTWATHWQVGLEQMGNRGASVPCCMTIKVEAIQLIQNIYILNSSSPLQPSLPIQINELLVL